MTPRLGIIVFARMSSTRLPGKMLLPVGPTTLLERVVARARLVGYPVQLATSSEASDDVLAGAGDDLGVPVFRGSRDDVLDRACQAARTAGFDAFARLCGDRPFLPIDDMRRALQRMEQCLFSGQDCDLVTTTRPRLVPPGLTTEVVRTGALERVRASAPTPEEREHVTSCLYATGANVAIHAMPSPLHDLPRVQMAVDTEHDRQTLGRVIEAYPQIDLPEGIAVRAVLELRRPIAATGPLPDSGG